MTITKSESGKNMKKYESFMLPEGTDSVFFIGICGISMSSLASITKRQGIRVGGSDSNDGVVAERLRQEGIEVFIGHSSDNVKGYKSVVYTAAIPYDNPELCYARENGLPIINRAEYLGNLMLSYENRIGVAGMHGKSSVTGMISHIFIEAGREPTVLNGANTAELDGRAFKIGRDDSFIFEACEYKDSFLSFYPQTAVLLNLEMDHVDYFKSMQQIKDSFAKYAAKAETVIAFADDDELIDAVKEHKRKLITYGRENEKANFNAYDIKENEFGYDVFKISYNGEYLCTVELSVPGEHNVVNATAAIAAAYLHGIDAVTAAKIMHTFKGVNRRNEYKGEKNGVLIYDDYAHHPSEIKASLHGLRKLCRGKLWCVYQPHTYSRTAGLFDEFCHSFAEADRVIFAEIFAAREKNTFGISSKDLAKNVEGSLYFPSFEEIADHIKANVCSGDLVVSMGAGDVYKVHELLLK